MDIRFKEHGTPKTTNWTGTIIGSGSFISAFIETSHDSREKTAV